MKQAFKPRVLAWLMALAGIAQASAQDVGTVEVVGQFEPLTQASVDGAKDKLKSIPGGASVVDLAQVREGRQSTWSDSLGLAPGVFIQDRFGSEEARISIRGSALSRTFHSFGIQVMQDGVPINFADGFFDMQTVDPNASRYVEVLRGPNAVAYGAATLGGAINFVAPTGHDSPAQLGRVELGSFGYRKAFGSTAGVVQSSADAPATWDYDVAGSHTRQDGFRDHSQMGSTKALANVGIRLDRDIESRFYAAVVRSRSQLPGYLTRSELEADPSIANSSSVGGVFPYRVDANQRRDVDAQRLANKTVIRQGDTQYEMAVYAMNYSLWHPIMTIVQQHAQTQGGHLQRRQTWGAHQLTVGYVPSFGTTRGTSSPTNNQGQATGSATSDYVQDASNHRVFAEDQYRLTERTTLVAALQYDRAKRRVQDVVLASNNLDRDYTQWSPRVGWLHDVSEQHQLFASVSRNFEAPIIGLLGSTTAATSAQTGVTVEAGSRGEHPWGNSALGWDATVYRAQLRNEFQTSCSNPPSCSSATTQNIPRTVHQGLELGVNHLHDRWLETRMAWLYSDFRFVDNPHYRNNRMPGFPPWLIRGEVLYRSGDVADGTSRWYAGPKFEWAPRAAPMDNTNTLSNPGYVVLGFKLGQNVDSTWSWFAEVRNISNKKYAATTNVAADYSTTSKATLAAYYPGDGRAVYVGLQAALN